jgi:hypothetical protein
MTNPYQPTRIIPFLDYPDEPHISALTAQYRGVEIFTRCLVIAMIAHEDLQRKITAASPLQAELNAAKLEVTLARLELCAAYPGFAKAYNPALHIFQQIGGKFAPEHLPAAAQNLGSAFLLFKVLRWLSGVASEIRPDGVFMQGRDLAKLLLAREKDSTRPATIDRPDVDQWLEVRTRNITVLVGPEGPRGILPMQEDLAL